MLKRLIATVTATAACVAVLSTPSSATPRQGGDDLPDGDGKKILQTACTTCHDLKEVTKFRGYYTRNEWQDIVKTMIEYGAAVEDKDVGVLVDYLAKTLGKPEGE